MSQSMSSGASTPAPIGSLGSGQGGSVSAPAVEIEKNPSITDSGAGESNPIIVAEENEPKRRKVTSKVWDHYTREVKGGGNASATCIYCKRKFDGSSSKGTTHLANHTKNCPLKRPKSDITQYCIGKTRTSNDPIPKIGTHKFDPMVERALFAKMIARHDMPFLTAEYEYFRLWISYCMPSYKCRSRNTVKTDLVTVFTEEKQRIYKEIENLPSRVTLTTDGWTAEHQNRGYFCLTCHYINDEWKLTKRIISFHVVEYPHHGVRLCEWLQNRILEWNIDKKLFGVVVDNASSNAGMLDGIRTWLNGKRALLHNGDMFHIRCSAHIVNLIVKQGLNVVHGLIEGIRKSVKYINSSPARDEKFALALSQTRLNNKKRVGLDVDTRWNSTYDMLHSALELRRAFERLADLDRDYKHLPTSEEWDMGKKICDCLEVFYVITKRLSGTKYPTANFYFIDVWQIRKKLMEWQASSFDYIRRMADLMQDKFDKYWDECSLVLTIAVILDPRYKMQIVRCAYEEIYGEYAEMYCSRVSNIMAELYSEYADSSCSYESVPVGDRHESSSTSAISDDTSASSVQLPPVLGRFRSFIKELTNESTDIKKTELEQYLEESLFPSDENPTSFDILHWWKHNGPKFPSLAKMARDILAVPVSTVASESAFGQARRIIDDTRASLNSDTVECLICVKDWLPSIAPEHGSSQEVVQND